ncbi:MAG: malic enzyme [Benjaminiella poitrasii]|nr:MAG: malic enzyme [Benjaminiella poitrasii]
MLPIADSGRRQSIQEDPKTYGKGRNISKSIELMPRSSYFNEGTAMDLMKRQKLGLAGLLPAYVDTLDVQKARVLRIIRSKKDALVKYILLSQLRTSNVRLFYKIVIDELEEIAPIIYTPTVGTACTEYSNIYPFLAPPGVSDGLYLTKAELPELCQAIRNYCPAEHDLDPEIAVITDGSRILGLGDLGSNGIGIPIGKLQLYIAAAGIDPRRTLPIILDVGTNNEKLLKDEFYLGLRQKRPNDEEFYEIVDKVITALRTVYPQLLIQFEDWSTEHAFGLLERYQHKILCFNDDIQGTGAVILSGLINAIRKVEKEDGVSPEDHRIVFHGAGSAAIGVARQIQSYFQIEHGMSEDEAKKLFWISDSKGLVTTSRGDKLPEHKQYYARNDTNDKQFKELLDIVNYVKPTVIIGLSSVAGTFTEEVLSRMAELNKQPIVFPLSNPESQAECTFEDAMKATDEKVIFASGTAFPAYKTSKGETVHPGQGNNMYIFPGLGLGAILSHTKHITDRMIYETSMALANSLTDDETAQGWLYPSLKRIRQVSSVVAAAVCQEALKEKLATSEAVIYGCKSHDDVVDYVISHMWCPTKEGYGEESAAEADHI